ncbi:MAG: hypothetical protein J2P18_04445 [Nocardia sp.]|nr:hypothetical protein [Nocardia sp.]
MITHSHGVIVLDGASTFTAGAPSARQFVDALGNELAASIDAETDLREVLSHSLEATRNNLKLQKGRSPCSTVAIIRAGANALDVLVLGDSTVVLGYTNGSHEILTDNRLEALQLSESARYRERLGAGVGYDAAHAELLGELQHRQQRLRNRLGGYWIAEADPTAADHAAMMTRPLGSVVWAIAATDGAFDVLSFLEIRWDDIASADDEGLRRLLLRLHSWEADSDPHGQLLPRAKQHDDKTIAVVRPWCSVSS